jgi:hypothetical protein
MILLFVPLFLTILLVGLLRHKFAIWLGYIEDVLVYLFSSIEGYATNPAENLPQFNIDAYLNWVMIRYLVVIILPFIVAEKLAATYLADIFETKVRIASKFIWSVSLWGGSQKICIKEGGLDSESEESPVAVIGGPGRVTVDPDSAGLFERPDGRPHVISSTIKPAVLDGFERFRQAIDLRDHRSEIDIPSRSLDGILVEAVNINFIFSVLRAPEQSVSPKHPYSFAGNNVIENLVYGLASRVNRLGYPNSLVSNDWTGTMSRLISSALGGFMSDHDLIEYLASYGVPEVQTSDGDVGGINSVTERLFPPDRVPLPTNSMSPSQAPTDFSPRPNIRTMLFTDFTSGFSTRTAQQGVELHWIGTGTWRTSSQIIPEKYLDAWRLSIDNLVRRREMETEDNHSRHIISFIQDIPLGRYQECIQADLSHYDTVHRLLVSYREQYIKLLSLFGKLGSPPRDPMNGNVRAIILEALQHINQILDSNPPGGGQPFGESPWDIPNPPTDNPSKEGSKTPFDGQDPFSGFSSTANSAKTAPASEVPDPGRPESPNDGLASAGEPSTYDEKPALQRSEEALYNELIILVNGDQEKADRLIELEQKRFPRESRRQWIIAARDRRLRDRGTP